MSAANDMGDTLEARLWAALRQRGVGLLGLTKSGLHPHPAAVFVESRRRRLWFAAVRDTELVGAIGNGGSAIFTAQAQGLMASIAGSLTVEDDPRRLARLAAATPAAWRPSGPHDSALVLLRMDCIDAEVTLSDGGMNRFVWELARPRFRGKARPSPIGYQPTLH
ncbi:MAG TPA: pyridoxamine 5'-phosphate oxidase family protein [Phenylobacterium sp.]|jgi:general stress protein 26